MVLQTDFLLDEKEFLHYSDEKRNIHIHAWLKNLSKLLSKAQKDDIKDIQRTLVEQLMGQLYGSNGHCTKKIVASNLATIFTIGDTFLLFESVNKCLDILKAKDDSANNAKQSQAKLASIICIGVMYDSLGRLMGRTYEETVRILLKFLKICDSQTRYEIYFTLKAILSAMGTAAHSVHREIYKSLKHGLVDRSMPVRVNATECFLHLCKYATFLHSAEIETVFSLCFRALENSNYEVRCSVAQTLGTLMSVSQSPSVKHSLQLQSSQNPSLKVRIVELEEVLTLLASGFLKGGSGFLKAGEMIKGSSGVSREVRLGIAHAYVAFFEKMERQWLERNLVILLRHLFEVLSSPKSCSTNSDALHSRRCVAFILRSITSRLLSEKGQFQACKQLVITLSLYSRIGRNEIGIEQSLLNERNPANLTSDIQLAQHVLVVILLELAYLLRHLAEASQTLLDDSQVSLIEILSLSISHPCSPVRLSSAWCFRCLCAGVPSQLTPQFERSQEMLDSLRNNADAIHGHSCVLSALLGTVRHTVLGIPHNKAKMVFNIAEDLLRTASQNSRLSMTRTQAGWQIMGAICTLGSSSIKSLLPRLLLLFKNCFPRNTKELDSEKERGDAFTWQVTLENRAGALTAMSSLLVYCPKLITEDVRRRLFIPVESALTMLVSLDAFFKTLGPAIKAAQSLVRLRLYQVLQLLPAPLYESCFANVLRLIVSDFTLTDSAGNTTSSTLSGLIQTNPNILLGSGLQDELHSLIEDQVQVYLATGMSSIENDSTVLYRSTDELGIPSSLPLSVSLIDESSAVFGSVFPYVAQKHRIQMLTHFLKCLKESKSSRQEAIQINVLTAILAALKNLAENKMSLGTEEVRNLVVEHITSTLNHPNALIRAAKAECLGRLVQIINDGKFVGEITHHCFEKLRTARDALSRTAYSLALGCIHHFVVGMGSVPQLKVNISLLLALAQDSGSPSVEVWALHALTLIAESGGPMFRPYVEATMAQCLKCLLTLPPSLIDVYQSIGKCISALITTVGPEFQSTTSGPLKELKFSALVACSILEDHPHSLVKSEAIGCLQQLHMFDKNNFDLARMLSLSCDSLLSPHQSLRRSTIVALHQIAQKHSKMFLDFGSVWLAKHKNVNKMGVLANFGARCANGFPAILVSLLDYEIDSFNQANIKKILVCLLQSLNESSLTSWIALFKDVLSASDATGGNTDDNDDAEEEGCDFKAKEEPSQLKITFGCETRIFMMSFLSKIISHCDSFSSSVGHFDMTVARQQFMSSKGKLDFLVLHLSDLVRMSFIGATSEGDQLRIEGLRTLQLVIEKFAHIDECEFPGHVILEQFQAQVGAALRPAFAVDTSSHVTAMACKVSSAWIGSGVAKDLNDLRRVHQLLVSSLDKLHKNSTSRLFNESASTMEKLAILRAWAEVYSAAKGAQNTPNVEESLLSLVSPELVTLAKYWILALKDHAMLTLPNEYLTQIPPESVSFFILETVESVRPMYRSAWPSMLNAAALWLSTDSGFDVLHEDSEVRLSKFEQFYLLFGICMEALSNAKMIEQSSNLSLSLESLRNLVQLNDVTRTTFAEKPALIRELCQTLHRILLTYRVIEFQLLIADILFSIVCIQSDIQISQRSSSQNSEDNVDTKEEQVSVIPPKDSLVQSLLEICLSILVHEFPQLCPTLANTPEISFLRSQKLSTKHLTIASEQARLIGKVLKIVTGTLDLCSADQSTAVLPTILFLLSGVFCELCLVNQTVYDEQIYNREPILSWLNCVQTLCDSRFLKISTLRSKWIPIIQSAVARVLDLSKTSDDRQKTDIISILLAIRTFMIYAPEEVFRTPQLQFPIVNFFTQTLQHEKDLVQLKCIESMKMIFERKENVSQNALYIQSIAPKLVSLFYNLHKDLNSGLAMSNAKIDSFKTILLCLETLIDVSSPEKRLSLIQFYIPALILLLNIPSTNTEPENVRLLNNSQSQRLHLQDFSLKKLTEFGGKYSSEFRTVMTANPAFGEALKSAIQLQQRRNINAASDNKSNTLSSASMPKITVDVTKFK